jgi:iron complex outermembrane receptor protein
MKIFFFTLLTNLLLVTTGITAQISNDTIRLGTVEITDILIKRKSFVTSEISADNLKSESTHDIGDYLRSVPNVSGIRKGGSAIDPVIRGFKFSQLNVVLDGGVKIENGCPNRMDPVTSHVEAEDISTIDVIKGPFVLNYGPALGGVINLQTMNPRPFSKFEIHANASVGYESNWDGQKEHLTVYGGNKKIYFLVNGGFRKYGDYMSGNIDGEATSYKTSFKKYNMGAKVGFTINPKQNLMVSYSEVHGRDVLFPALTMDEKSDDTWIAAIDYSFKNLSEVVKEMDLKVYHSDVHHVMDNSFRPNWANQQMVAIVDAHNTGGKAVMGMKFGDYSIKTGIDFENIYKDGTRTMTMEMMGETTTKKLNLWNKATINNAGLFAGFTRLYNKFVFNAMLRFDFNDANSGDTLKIIHDGVNYYNELSSQFLNLSANLGVTRNITNNFSASLAFARASRSPNMLERYIKLLSAGYDSYDYLGNPQLKPEINNEADLTLTFAKEKFGELYFNYFYSFVQDYISSELVPSSVVRPATPGAPGVKQFVNVDYVTFTGFEMGFTSPQNYKFGGSVVAAFTYGKIPTVTKYIVSGNQVTGDTIIKNDALTEIPPFETTIAVHYKMLKGSLIPALSYRLVADQRHVSEAFYEPETPGFGLLNFSINYKMSKNFRILAGVNNIFDRSYYEHLNRKIIGTTEKLYEPGRSFFINLSFDI